MNRARRAMSSGVIALGMLAALSPSAVSAVERGPGSATQAQVRHQHSTPPVACIAGILGCNGTSTPELPSGALVGIGLIPPVVLGLMIGRRRRRRP